jgi:hypothetical protein
MAPSFGMLLINQYSFTFLFLACMVLSSCAFFFSYKLKGKEIVTSDKGNFYFTFTSQRKKAFFFLEGGGEPGTKNHPLPFKVIGYLLCI